MKKSALEIIQAFQQSMGSGTDEWENLLTENISFKGPVDKVEGKEAFITLNKNFSPLIKGYVPVSVVEQGDKVSLEGIFTISTPKGNTIDLEMMEIYEVNNEKIQNVRVYYDAEEFRREFS